MFKRKRSKKKGKVQPTVSDIVQDELAQTASIHWVPGPAPKPPFQPQLVNHIYKKELASFDLSRVVMLEFSSYLENYLWKHFNAKRASFEHVMSMMLMVNEKFRENSTEPWECFHSNLPLFLKFFDRVFRMKDSRKLSMKEKHHYLIFLIHTFSSLENQTVRNSCLRLLTIALWKSVDPGRLRVYLIGNPKMAEVWERYQVAAATRKDLAMQETFIPKLLKEFFEVLHSINVTDPTNIKRQIHQIRYCERFLELVIDVLSQLATRRYFKLLVSDQHFLEKCRLSPFGKYSRMLSLGEFRLFGKLLDMVEFYLKFEIDDQTGDMLTDRTVMQQHYLQLQILQRIAFKYFSKELLPVALATVSTLDTRKGLSAHLQPLPASKLRALCVRLKLLPEAVPESEEERKLETKEYMLEVLIKEHERRLSRTEAINALPLYPTEDMLWDPNLVPEEHYDGRRCLALPKLNLQFLTIRDYLLRNFTLYRLESTYEIRDDLAKAIIKIRPRLSYNPDSGMNDTIFTGYSRYGIPIARFQVVDVGNPNLGENKPSVVKAEIDVDLGAFKRGTSSLVREEWEELKEHDCMFLCTIRGKIDVLSPEHRTAKDIKWDEANAELLGLTAVRGCEVVEVKDENGDVIGERDVEGNVHIAVGDRRTFCVQLDCAQYQKDMTKIADENADDVYKTFNLLIRRRAKENNFKAVLETIRNLMNSDCVVPDWLHDVFLGYGDVESAQYYRMPDDKRPASLDFNDTFLHEGHLREAFPGRKLVFKSKGPRVPPFRLTFDKREPDPDYTTVSGELRGAAPAVPGTAYEAPGTAKSKSGSLTNGASKEDAPSTSSKAAAEASASDPADSKTAESKSSADASPASTSSPSLTSAQIDKMSTSQLRAHLKKRKLNNRGRRVVLQRRLKAAATGQAAGGFGGRRQRKKRVPNAQKPPIAVESYALPRNDPFPEIVRRKNHVRFTPVQIEAIRSGMQPGLTMVVGPPGTGKTDVAVQIINNLYHNFPEERTLLVTHSNQALNDLFEKIAERNIDERHLLRLGYGHRDLDTEANFGKFGRLNYMLQRRMDILARVRRLSVALKLGDGEGFTCENARHFFFYHVVSRWEQYLAEIDKLGTKLRARRKNAAISASSDADGKAAAASATNGVHSASASASAPMEDDVDSAIDALNRNEEIDVDALSDSQLDALGKKIVKKRFPFHDFFIDAIQPVFKQNSFEQDLSIAKTCFTRIKEMFDELEECRPFEILRRSRDRGDFLSTTHAKIIALTCTHAALKRSDLIELRFQYDNIVMEEAAQVLEIETFIPMMLQKEDAEGGARLKRVVLIGDHHQLPPVVKNMAFQKYSHFDQSMFTRFARLGMPLIKLDMQGRARPSLAKLYSWRYQTLGNLPNVINEPQFQTANAGFSCEYQLINVEDYEGKGEFCPNPYFYQNLGEAEYLVQLYMYMRLVGYPAEKISIITTYNGQKHLIRDVIRRRCEENPLFGEPARITTVDRFQGQQNDYVLLSLVRTQSVGHLRDVRRLVVALSRARLGLYVFCRQRLFENCYELTPSFTQLTARPTKLHIVPNEMHPTLRPVSAASKAVVVEDVVHLGSIVAQMAQIASNTYQRNYDHQMAEYKRAWAQHQALMKQKAEQEERERLATEAEEAKKAEASEKKGSHGMLKAADFDDLDDADLQRRVGDADRSDDEDDDAEGDGEEKTAMKDTEGPPALVAPPSGVVGPVTTGSDEDESGESGSEGEEQDGDEDDETEEPAKKKSKTESDDDDVAVGPPMPPASSAEGDADEGGDADIGPPMPTSSSSRAPDADEDDNDETSTPRAKRRKTSRKDDDDADYEAEDDSADDDDDADEGRASSSSSRRKRSKKKARRKNSSADDPNYIPNDDENDEDDEDSDSAVGPPMPPAASTRPTPTADDAAPADHTSPSAEGAAGGGSSSPSADVDEEKRQRRRRRSSMADDPNYVPESDDEDEPMHADTPIAAIGGANTASADAPSSDSSSRQQPPAPTASAGDVAAPSEDTEESSQERATKRARRRRKSSMASDPNYVPEDDDEDDDDES